MGNEMKSEIHAVDCVIRLLYGHKEMVIQALCGNAAEDYKEEWRARDVFLFWCHLDIPWQRQVVEMAVEFYRSE